MARGTTRVSSCWHTKAQGMGAESELQWWQQQAKEWKGQKRGGLVCPILYAHTWSSHWWLDKIAQRSQVTLTAIRQIMQFWVIHVELQEYCKLNQNWIRNKLKPMRVLRKAGLNAIAVSAIDSFTGRRPSYWTYWEPDLPTKMNQIQGAIKWPHPNILKYSSEF